MKRSLQEAAAMLTAFASNPAAMALWKELEHCRVQAIAAGVEAEFESFWNYELERSKELPGAAVRPKQVLQLTLKLA